MKTPVLNPFTLDSDSHSSTHGIEFKDPSKTVQSDARQADINEIVKQFGVTGQLPYGNAQPVFDDFTSFPTDYHTALNYINEADGAFMELPASVRTEFDNDPGKLLSFVADGSNRARAVELGLVPPPLPEDAPQGADGLPPSSDGDNP